MPELTPEKRLSLAGFILQTVQDYEAPSFPGRPSAITYDDHELIEAYREASVGVKVTADKRRQLSYFGAWRALVWRTECRAGGHLCTVVGSAQDFASAGKTDEAEVLFSFAEHHYPRFNSEKLPTFDSWLKFREWCEEAAKNYSLLPKYMRTMEAPRGGVPFHRPQGKRSESDVARPGEDQNGFVGGGW